MCQVFFLDCSTLGVAKMSSVAYGCERRVNFKHFDFSVFGKHVFFSKLHILLGFSLDFPGGRRFSTISWGRLGSETSCRLPDAP
jgi:hypothetical protein